MKKNILLLITSIGLFLISAFLLLGGAWLVKLGGSWYYLLMGIATFITAVLVLKANRKALPFFAITLFATTIWALSEVGLNWWQLVPRLWIWFIVGVVLLLPWWRKPLMKNSEGMCRLILTLSLSISVLITTVVGVASLFTSPGVIVGNIDNELNTKVNKNQVAGDDWTVYGGTNAGLHYSSLEQITPENIGRLKEAWRIQTGDMPTASDPVELTNENTPLKVNDKLYACTAHGWVIALEPETGKTLWKFQPQLSSDGADTFKGWAHMTCRGVSYYDADKYLAEDPSSSVANAVKASSSPKRIYLPTADARLIALDAETGRLVSEFNNGGSIDLTHNLRPMTPGGYYSTSPALVTKNLIIVGGHVTDDESTNEPSGVVRAYDINDGHLVWNWDAGNPDVTTPIAKDGQYTRNSPNVWSIMSADEENGLIYLPVGNQTPDQYGPNRSPGAEKYGAGIVALDLKTGHVRWNYQLTHHDLWDMDTPSQPVLVDLKTANGIEPAVIQPTKQGSLYVLNRLTGKAIVPIDEIEVPQGAVDAAEQARLSKTQPRSQLNLLPKPLTEQDMWGATPFDQLSCRIAFKSLRYEGQYTPPSLQGSLVYPGNVGVLNWGGIAVDPARQIIFSSPNYMAFVSKLIPRDQVEDGAVQASEGAGLQPNKGAPYAVELRPFLSAVGFPCQAPTWGDVAGIDLTTASVKWKHPNGTSYDSTPVIPLAFPVGVPAMGGPMTTAGGVSFLSGTLDQFLRGYDVKTGQQIWKARLPAGGQATPMTYKGKDGKQYVLLVVGGHGSFGTKMGDYIIAYTLDDSN